MRRMTPLGSSKENQSENFLRKQDAWQDNGRAGNSGDPDRRRLPLKQEVERPPAHSEHYNELPNIDSLNAEYQVATLLSQITLLATLASCRSPPKCNCQCNLKYDPVCAVDSKGIEETYPNKCSFECFKCTFSKTDLVIRKRGECAPRRPPSRSEKRKPETRQSNALRTTPPKCNCNCPFISAPVCAIDAKGVTETYPNQCVFDCYKCTHGKDLRVQSQGECPPNPPPRPTPGSRQKPDAGTTGQKPGRNGQCNCRCTFEYNPVCAGDSKGVKETYPTACAFECYKCTHGKDLQILNRGECSENPRPNRPSPNQTGKCNCQCPLNYDPVCAADSRGNEETYPNACAFECYKCTHRKDTIAGLRSEEGRRMPKQFITEPAALQDSHGLMHPVNQPMCVPSSEPKRKLVFLGENDCNIDL
ncbi:Agrin [Gryllus bimaculatus]|nr:Agrin [Gryllus bimaculatus]